MSFRSSSASPSSVAISIGEQRIRALESRVKYLEMTTEESSDLIAGLYVHNETHIELISKLSDQLRGHQLQVNEQLDKLTSVIQESIVDVKRRSSNDVSQLGQPKALDVEQQIEEVVVEQQETVEVEQQKTVEIEKPVEKLDCPPSCYNNFIQDMFEATSTPKQHSPKGSIPVVDLASSDEEEDPIAQAFNGKLHIQHPTVFTQEVPVADVRSSPISMSTQSLNRISNTSLQPELPVKTTESDVILFDNVDLRGCSANGDIMNKLAVGCLHLKARSHPIEIKFVAEDGEYEEYVVKGELFPMEDQKNAYLWTCSVKGREGIETRIAMFGSENEFSRFGQACNREA